MTSPPRPALRASRSVMSPLEVEITAVPRPPRIFGMASLATYQRCPGLELRLTPEMAGWCCASQRRVIDRTLRSSTTDSVTAERKPSSRRTSARRFLSFEPGTSTVALRDRIPLRMRVRRSAIGSVMVHLCSSGPRCGSRSPGRSAAPRSRGSIPAASARTALPARLHDAGDLALERQEAEAEAAELELPHVRARAPAQRATVAIADLPLLLARDLLSQTSHGEFLFLCLCLCLRRAYCLNGIPRWRSSARPSSS